MVNFICDYWVLFAILFFVFAAIATVSFLGIVYLIRKSLFATEQASILLEVLREFQQHLEKFNSADLFFGEPAVLRLLEHIKYIISCVENYLATFEFLEKGKLPESVEDDENQIIT